MKPVLFRFDPEFVHDRFTDLGSVAGKSALGRKTLEHFFTYTSPVLERTIDGITLPNPVGLAAGFDYTGRMAKVLSRVGFGFNTVGTVTARPYDGNPKPRLLRLVKSQSLLVNKGFKSPGADVVKRTLDAHGFTNEVIGISVGSSNVPEVDTIAKAIDDYLYTLTVFKDAPYVRYFEINISCPNARISEQFADSRTFTQLLKAMESLHLTKPLWLKMANEITVPHCEQQIRTALQHGMKTFILTNLVKKRTNPYLDPSEVQRIATLKGNFSGIPTRENALRLIQEMHRTFTNEIDLIGVGGIFTPQQAQETLAAGAIAVQLITGMIYKGPALVREILEHLAQ